MFGKYNRRATYIPYVIFMLFSLGLFAYSDILDLTFSLYIICSCAVLTYILFSKKFSYTQRGYCISFLILITLTWFSAKMCCMGAMHLSFLFVIALNSFYNSIGVNVFEIVYITLYFVGYAIIYPGAITASAGSSEWLVVRFFILYVGWIVLTLGIIVQKKNIQTAMEKSKMAEKANRVKSDFLANMSHEIRTPMNAILGMVELALRSDMSDESSEYVKNIRSAGRNLLEIINDILDFSKIESGKMDITDSEYEILSIINDIVSITRNPNLKNDIEFIVDADPNIPRVLFGDEVKIKQVMLNFLSNAIKFTNKGSVKLSISFFKKDYGINLMVSVKDTGIGIRERDIEKLFNSFQQLDTHKNRRVEGTGLGLCVSKQLVELMGGFVNVKSVYGEGSEFSFIIPQNVIDKNPCVCIENSEEYSVLVCESGEHTRTSIKKNLDELKIANSTCKTVNEAINLISENKFTHIFIEYSDYIKNKSKLNNISDIEIIALYNSQDYIDHSENVRCLSKPVYHLTIAKALSGDKRKNSAMLFTEAYQNKFTAPDAKILLVDDNLVNLRVAEGLLRPYNMKIYMVTSGMEAIDKIREEEFDIVFMDHMMPVMDGVETTKAIRAMEGDYFKKLPIIALTANAINGARDFFLKSGMNDFVSKPIEMRDIAAKLKQWIPDEKIINGGDNTYMYTPDSYVNSSKVKNKKKIDDGVNIDKGIMNCGGNEEIYKSIVQVFVDDIDEKSKLIPSLLKEGNIKDYIIEVHALKSASRSIGASELANLAQNLEKAGKDNDISTINKNTEELIEKYTALKKPLLDYCKSQTEIMPDKTEDELEIIDVTDKVISDVAKYEKDDDCSDDYLFGELERLLTQTDNPESVEIYEENSNSGDYNSRENQGSVVDIIEKIERNPSEIDDAEVKNFSADAAWDYEYDFSPFGELEMLESCGFAGKAEKDFADVDVDSETNEEEYGVHIDEENILSEIFTYDDVFDELNSLETQDADLSMEEKFGFSVNSADAFNNIECRDGIDSKCAEVDIDVTSDGVNRVISEVRRLAKLENVLDVDGEDKTNFENPSELIESVIMEKVHNEILPSSISADITKYSELCFKIKEFKASVDNLDIPTAEKKLYDIGTYSVVYDNYRKEFEKIARLMRSFEYERVSDICGRWIKLIERECAL